MPIKEETMPAANAGIQHPIPQNVMDVEFKVIGDLTVRQLFYLFIGVGIAVIVFKSNFNLFWTIILAGIPVTMSVAVAFFPYQERGLDKWLVSFLRAMRYNTQMIWKKTYSPPAYFLADYAEIIRNEIVTLTPAKSRSKLDEYLGQLPENMNSLDIEERERMEMLSNTMTRLQVDHPMEHTNVEPKTLTIPVISMTSTNNDLQAKVNTPPQTQLDQDLESLSESTKAYPKTELKEPSANIEPTSPSGDSNANTNDTTKNNNEPNSKMESRQGKKANNQIENESNNKNKNTTNNTSTTTKTENQAPPRQEAKPTLEEINEQEIKSKAEMLDALTGTKVEILSSTRIDRPLETLPDDLKGEIKIKTTTRLPPTIVAQDIKEIRHQEKILQKKVNELLDVTKRAKLEASTSPDNSTSYQSRIEVFQKKYNELNTEREKINTEIEKNTARIDRLSGDKQKQPLEKLVTNLQSKNTTLERNLKQIESELFELKNDPEQSKSKGTAQTQEDQYQDQTQAKVDTQTGTEQVQMNHRQDQTAQTQTQAETQAQTQTQPQAQTQGQIDSSLTQSNQQTEQIQTTSQEEAEYELPNPTPLNRQKLVYKEGQRPKNTYSANNLKKSRNKNEQSSNPKNKGINNLNTTNTQNQNQDNSQNSNNQNQTIAQDTEGNILSGTIKGSDGQFISGGIVLIKDNEGNVIRALKTNKMGQYKVKSPLSNGKYTVEAIKGGEKFDIIQFEATGAVINPIHIIANK